MTYGNRDDYDFFGDWEEEVDPAEEQKRQASGKKFREQFEELLAANKRQQAFIDGVMKERQQAALVAKLESRNLDPKVANLIPEGLDAAGQDKWLEDNGALFAKTVTTETTSQTAPAEGEKNETPGVAPEIVANLTISEMAALQQITQEAAGEGSVNQATLTPAQKLASFDDEAAFWAHIDANK